MDHEMNKRDAIIAELPRIRRYARALVKDADAADDLVQDCVERALSRLHLFRDGSDMRAWLFTIMHGLFVNSVRSRKPAANASALDAATEIRTATPPAQAHGLEVRDLAVALAALSDEQREVVLLIGLESMSYKETARIVGVPMGTVMSRLARGRERLRALTGADSDLLRRAK
jgi:RNA polymerase sigma-70 factor (ECF subfamily)